MAVKTNINDRMIKMSCDCANLFESFFFGKSDIDECVVHKSYNLCLGLCENTRGSYRCTCPHGYALGPDGRSCQVNAQSIAKIINLFTKFIFFPLLRTSTNVPRKMSAPAQMRFARTFEEVIVVHTNVVHRTI